MRVRFTYWWGTRKGNCTIPTLVPVLIIPQAPPPGGPGQEPFAWDSSYLMNMGITKVMAARTVFYLLMTARQNN